MALFGVELLAALANDANVGVETTFILEQFLVLGLQLLQLGLLLGNRLFEAFDFRFGTFLRILLF
jgi:hypothetical protein